MIRYREYFMFRPVHKLMVVLCLQGLALHACDADFSESDDEVSAIVTGKVQSDGVQTRLISVYLKPLQDSNYTPLFDGRIVVAESVSTVPVTVAKGSVLTEGVDVVHVGASCQGLQETYPEIRNCEEEETAEFQYGAAESTATINAEGFTQLYVGDSEKYRLRVKSWATEEDANCFWGGQETLDSAATDITLQVHVFCE